MNLMKKKIGNKRFISRKNFLHNLKVIKQNIKTPSNITPKEVKKVAATLSVEALKSIPKVIIEHIKKHKKVVKKVVKP